MSHESKLSLDASSYAAALARLRDGLRLQTIPSGDNRGARPLAALTTRDADDPTLALLDAWSMACDVLGFYQVRFADEGYLATARERRSVLELAGLIGYIPDPGLAAEVLLAFTAEDAPGSPDEILVDAGTAVMSVPAPGGAPQHFETAEGLLARPAWNALKLYRPVEVVGQHLGRDTEGFELRGIIGSIRPGDQLLLGLDQPTSKWALTTVTEVAPDPVAGRTRIHCEKPTVFENLELPAPTAPTVIAFRHRVGLFGHNARDVAEDDEWPLDLTQGVALSHEVGGIGPGSWVLLCDGDTRVLGTVDTVTSTSRAAFGLAARVTHITLAGVDPNTTVDRRSTTTFVASERLTLAEDEFISTAAITGPRMTLDGPVDGLLGGRSIAVSGLDMDGSPAAEMAWLLQIDHDDENLPVLVLGEHLEHDYAPGSVRINANIARADHGKTTREVLGSGDGSTTHQRFKLRNKPLTYISAATAQGSEPALRVRVDGALYKQVESLAEARGDQRAYQIEIAEDQTAILCFGDGVSGARLPTGRDNVVATYRHGQGNAGEVHAGSLILMPARPPGIKGVINVEAATNGADPETREQIRDNAPVGVRTLDRLVSVQDHADYAQAFAGVGRAHATELSLGTRRVVYVSALDSDGNPFEDDDSEDDPSGPEAVTVLANLEAAMSQYGAPNIEVEVDSAVCPSFELEARLLIDHDLVPSFEDVDQRARVALRARWALDEVAFGQPIPTSEVIALLQGIHGVLAVDLDRLCFVEDDSNDLVHDLDATLAQADGEGGVTPTELLVLRDAYVTLEEWET